LRGTGPGGSSTLTPAPPVAIASSPIINVRELDAFLSALPRESISFLAKSQEVRYDHTKIAGQSINIGSLAVPQNYIWVLTDVEFYAYAPSSGLGAQPKTLDEEALVGLLRLDILFGGSSPLNSQSNRMSPYTEPAQSAMSTSGWPWLERPFGVQRMPSFALYAKENQTVDLMCFVEVPPRFPIGKLGVNIHGFALPTSVFSGIWIR
jgi:hypothetical protein